MVQFLLDCASRRERTPASMETGCPANRRIIGRAHRPGLCQRVSAEGNKRKAPRNRQCNQGRLCRKNQKTRLDERANERESGEETRRDYHEGWLSGQMERPEQPDRRPFVVRPQRDECPPLAV